jgi:hypothetical protein
MLSPEQGLAMCFVVSRPKGRLTTVAVRDSAYGTDIRLQLNNSTALGSIRSFSHSEVV